MSLLALVSGLPRAVRKKVSLLVLQSWIDDTGKDARASMFTLAGFIARIKIWAAFADEWTSILNKAPRLDYFKSYEAQHRCGQFAGWNKTDRDKRVKDLSQVIVKYLAVPSACARSFSIPIKDYEEILAQSLYAQNAKLHPHRNPFYLGFIATIAVLLEEAYSRSVRESIHLLFDNGIDRKALLEDAYKKFIAVIEKERPGHYSLLTGC
jgi:hypothetical protein